MLLTPLIQEHTNDCFRTCAACILPFDRSELPDNKGGVRLDKLTKPTSRWSRWANRNGYVVHMSWKAPADRYYIGQYCIAGHTATVHSLVCYNGEILHNPARVSYPIGEFFNAVWFEKRKD